MPLEFAGKDKHIKLLKLIFSTDGISPYAMGGMARHARLLIEELSKTGKADIVAVHPHKTQVFAKELNIKEISIAGINPHRNYLLECYRYSKRVYAALEKYPDYIIYSQGLSVWFGIEKLTNRLVINPHGLDPYLPITIWDFLLGLPFRIIFNYLFSYSAKVISQGGSLTNILRNNIKDAAKIAVLPNGVNMPEGPGLFQRFRNGAKNLRVLFLGRFVRSKGINILLMAAKELNDSGYIDKITYFLGGAGPLYAYYSHNFKYRNVNYLGLVLDEQLPDLYKNSDLFVLPSFTEGMPMAALEAMSYSLPLILSDVAATPELADESNGYLIERNNVQALKKAIISFYDLSAEEKNRLSRNSYDKAKNHFTWKNIVGRYIEVFRELADNHPLKKQQA